MKRAFGLKFVLVMLSLTSFANAIDFDSYVGRYTYSKKEGFREIVKKRPGASVHKDAVFVAPLNQIFKRYILSSVETKYSPIMTIYINSAGEMYSFLKDQSGLSRNEDFKNSQFLSFYFDPGVRWVPMKQVRDNKLKVVFWANDYFSKESSTLTFNDSSIVIETMAATNIGFPIKVVNRFDIAD